MRTSRAACARVVDEDHLSGARTFSRPTISAERLTQSPCPEWLWAAGAPPLAWGHAPNTDVSRLVPAPSARTCRAAPGPSDRERCPLTSGKRRRLAADRRPDDAIGIPTGTRAPRVVSGTLLLLASFLVWREHEPNLLSRPVDAPLGNYQLLRPPRCSRIPVPRAQPSRARLPAVSSSVFPMVS